MKFKEYYPTYLSKHKDFRTRLMHYVGIWMTFFFVGWCIGANSWWYLLISPFIVYPFAWAGHFLFEKNTPAAFKNPFLAKLSDFYMYYSEMTGRIKKQLENLNKNDSK